jgi:hypothetical protein
VKVDTLTGPNLSYWVAKLEGEKNLIIDGEGCFCEDDLFGNEEYDYACPITFQPIAEREWIGVEPLDTDDEIIVWKAKCRNRKQVEGEKFKPVVTTYGSTMAEAMMRCYVKSYLGDDTKE